MYCKYCGKEIEDDSKFCKHCGKQLQEITPIDEVGVSCKEEKPIQIAIASKFLVKKETIANEIIANLKMIGLAFCVIVAYLIGFIIYHTNDVKPLDDNGYWGESCYDPSSQTNMGELSWEREYYRRIYYVKPYSQWNPINKKIGILDENPISPYDFIHYTHIDSNRALERANEIANEKKLPEQITKRILKKSKETVERNRQEFQSYISSFRKGGFERDLENKIKWCAIISFTFFILGRYLIKFGKWVTENKTEQNK